MHQHHLPILKHKQKNITGIYDMCISLNTQFVNSNYKMKVKVKCFYLLFISILHDIVHLAVHMYSFRLSVTRVKR